MTKIGGKQVKGVKSPKECKRAENDWKCDQCDQKAKNDQKL